MNDLIYVLKADTISVRQLPPGTALIGGSPDKDGFISVHSQERIANNTEMDSYAWRLYHAADRRYTGRPPTGCAGCDGRGHNDCWPLRRWPRCRSGTSDPQTVQAWSGEIADAVLGHRYKAGPLNPRTAEGLHREPRAWQLHQANNIWLIRTQAGQVLQSDCSERGACVHTLWKHNDPELPEILRKAEVAERTIARVVGAPAFGEVETVIAVPSPTHRYELRFVGSVPKLVLSAPNPIIQSTQLNLPEVNQRISLVSMANDPVPIEAGNQGVATKIRHFGEWAQIEVDWENGKPIMMSIPPDVWEPAE